MLDKPSEKVLRYAVSKYNSDFCSYVNLSPQDVEMNASHLNNICESLCQNGYLSEHNYFFSDTEESQITLTYKGISYFNYKRMERIKFLMPIVLETILSLAVIAISIVNLA